MAFGGWTYKCELQIQNTNVDSDLSYFPILLVNETLPEQIYDTDGAGPALEGGGDIRFSSDAAGDTRLPCEIVRFERDPTPASANVEIWVRIATVSSSSTTSIYIWWGKTGETQPAQGSPYGQHETWDESGSSYFKLVNHMDDDPGPGGAGDMLDSSEEENDGQADASMVTGDLVTGAFQGNTRGRGIDFDGSDDDITIGDADSLDPGAGADWTMEAWAKPPDSDQIGIILTKWAAGGGDNPQYTLSIADDMLGSAGKQFLGFYIENYAGDDRKSIANADFVDGDYHHVCAVADNTDDEVNLYVDGSEEAKTTDDNGSWPLSSTSGALTIGQQNGANFYDGELDEIRLSEINRSAAWINATFHFADAPGTNILEQSVVTNPIVISRLDASDSVAAATLSYSVSAGTDRGLIVFFSWEHSTSTSVTGATYGGQTMTEAFQEETADAGFVAGIACFYILDAGITAAVGTTISPTYSTSPNDEIIHAASYENIDQTGGATTVPATATDETNASTPNPFTTIDLTEVDGGLIVAAVSCGNASSATWQADMQEQEDTTDSSSFSSFADRLSTTDANVTIEGTIASQNRTAVGSARFAQAVALASPTSHIEGPLFGPLGGPI